MPERVVTIDGPAGAGKSTVAKALAARLNWRLLDTGAMYRTVALACLRAQVDLREPDAILAVAQSCRARFDGARVELDGADVSELVRTTEVTAATKWPANAPGVRALLVGWQREFAREHQDVVTEGRDQGTVVFPGALLKVYLTASPEARARRRQAERLAAGEAIAFEELLKSMTGRDAEDQARAVGPLSRPIDALELDTSGMAPAAVVDWLERAARERLEEKDLA